MATTSGGTVTGTKTYYPAAGAMRIGSTLYYVLKDHLGSASVPTDASGNLVTGADTRYYPFGEARFSTAPMLTDKLFTGQREITGLGIYHYGARFYSPKLGRFLSADTIVPGRFNPQSLNRFSYVNNNPLLYTDPSGHMIDNGCSLGCSSTSLPSNNYCTTHPGSCGGGGGGNHPPTTSPAVSFTYDSQEIANQYVPWTASQWGSASSFLDKAALGADILAAFIVLGHVVVGAAGRLVFEGNPAGAAGGYIIGEMNPVVRGLVGLGNGLAVSSTYTGLVQAAKTGDNRLIASINANSSQANISISENISGNSVASVALTAASLGDVPVPAEALYGAQTQRATQNFQISGLKPRNGVCYNCRRGVVWL